MAIDTVSPRSRRALLAAGLGAAGASVISALGRPEAARAADGQAVILGDDADNRHLIYTKITNSQVPTTFCAFAGNDAYGVLGHNESANGPAVFGQAFGQGGIGVQGESTAGIGVRGTSGSVQGVYGQGAIGVEGTSANVYGWGVGGSSTVSGGTGVRGEATGAGSHGVWGYSAAGRGVQGEATSGRGVHGQATSGIGLYGQASTGYALRTSGRLKVDKASGIATIPAGNSAWPVSPGLDLTSASFVLLTPRGNLGSRSLWYTVDTTANTFTIRVSSAVAADLKIGWLLLG